MKTEKQIIKIITAIFLSLFLILSFSHAQILPRKIKRKVNDRLERKVEQKVEKKVDEKIDDALDKIFEKASKKGEEDDTETDGSTDEVKVRNEGDEVIVESEDSDVSISFEKDEEASSREVKKSDWTGSIQMEMREMKNGKLKKDYPMNITYHIDEYKMGVEMEESKDGHMIMIIDRQNRKITQKITDEKGKKTAVIMPMMNIKVNVKQKDVEGEASKYSLSETGRTKDILGYSCKEYQLDGPDEVTYVWVTDELGLNYNDFIDFVQVKNSQGGPASMNNIYGISGFALESRTESKKDDSVSEMQVTEIGKLNFDTFSTDGYEVQDISSMMKH